MENYCLDYQLNTLHEFKIPCFYDIKHRETELLPTRRFTITNSISCVECAQNALEIKSISITQLQTLKFVVLASLEVYCYNYGVKIMGVTKNFMIGFKGHSIIRNI